MKQIFITTVLMLACTRVPAVEPVDKELIPEARAVLAYLESVYGKKSIAALNGADHIEGILQASGKQPAIVGFDLSDWNSPPWGKSYTGVVQNSVHAAKAWWQKGGINEVAGIGKPQVDTYVTSFETMKQVAPGKMIALAECEAIPNPDKLAKDGPPWLYCLPWWGVGKKHTAEWAKSTYAHGHFVTLDQLPKWKSLR